MPMININNADFYYETHGKGKPVLLVSGLACDHLAWTPIINMLKSDYQVVVFDNRAIGKTKDDGKSFTVEQMATDAASLIRHLELEKPHIIAHSMGGCIAQALAVQDPELIDKLVLAATSAKFQLPGLMACELIIKMREKNVDPDIFFDYAFLVSFSEKFLRNQDTVIKMKEGFAANANPQSIADHQRQMQALKTFDGVAQLSKIRAQTLVIAADNDMIIMPQEIELLCEKIPNATRENFAAGHTVILEEPELFSKACIRFFNTCYTV